MKNSIIKSNEYIGLYSKFFSIKEPEDFLNLIRREFLYFDKIVIPSFFRSFFVHSISGLKKRNPTFKKYKSIIEIIDRYIESNILIDAKKYCELIDAVKFGEFYSTLGNLIFRNKPEGRAAQFSAYDSKNIFDSYSHQYVLDNFTSILGYNESDINKYSQKEISFILSNWSSKNNYNVIPILEPQPYILDSSVSESDVISIILKEFPVPPPNVDIKDLLDFKNQNHDLIIKLREYISNLVKKYDNINDIKFEMENILIKFSKKYKRELKNIEYSKKQILYKLPRRLATFKIDKHIIDMIEIEKKRILLPNEIQNFDGNEIAYISVIKEKYKF